MWKSGIFDVEDINKTLLEKIVYFYINYPGMSGPGCVFFFTEHGDEYTMSEYGTDWEIGRIVKFFPEIYDAWVSRRSGVKDEYGYTVSGNWKIIPAFEGLMLVRVDYFEKFYEHYRTANKTNKEIPITIARISLGRKQYVTDERMVFIKNHEAKETYLKEERERRLEKERNRLSDVDVPWMKFQCEIFEGYMKLLVRKNINGTVSAYRWVIQFQKEQEEEGCYGLNPQIECYNVFLTKYEDLDVKEVEDIENFYNKYVRECRPGEFYRSYRELDKAKKAVGARNEMIGWGNVNKKNMFILDYDYLKDRVESDKQLLIL